MESWNFATFCIDFQVLQTFIFKHWNTHLCSILYLFFSKLILTSLFLFTLSFFLYNLHPTLGYIFGTLLHILLNQNVYSFRFGEDVYWWDYTTQNSPNIFCSCLVPQSDLVVFWWNEKTSGKIYLSLSDQRILPLNRKYLERLVYIKHFGNISISNCQLFVQILK